MKSGLMNKAFLITGASGGIGRATAQAFAEEGARLALHYHTNRESVEELSHSIDVDTVLVGGNVAKEEDVETMYRDALSSLKRLDGIVVNAGIWIAEETPLHRMSLEQWNTTMATDLSGAFLTCREFLRHLESDAPLHRMSLEQWNTTMATDLSGKRFPHLTRRSSGEFLRTRP